MRKKSLLIPGVAALALVLAACGGSTQVSSGADTNSPAAGASSAAPAGSSTPAASADSGTTSGSFMGSAMGSGYAVPSGSVMASGSGSAPASDSASPAAWKCPTATDSFTLDSGGDVNIQDLFQKTLLPTWKTACPNISIKFVFDTHSANNALDVAKIAAAEKSGQSAPYDLVEDYTQLLAQAGLAEPLTPALIPSMSQVSQAAVAQVKGFGVPYRGSSVLLAYDSTKVTNPPKTLADLLTWIKANPGKFTYNSPATGGSGYSFVETVVDSKMPADLVKKMQTAYDPSLESNFAPGLAVLKDLTPSIYQNVYPNGNQAVLDLLNKGEIEMAPVWSDQFLSALSTKQLGKQFKVTQISDPSFTGGVQYLAIVKGSTHKAAAASFIDWMLQPAQQAKIVTTIAGFPAIPIDKLPADAQGAFAGVDTQNLRLTLSSKTQTDLQKQWAQTVTG
ncbi:MAG: extracellular solute-binding protein [Nakamurella sp.]